MGWIKVYSNKAGSQEDLRKAFEHARDEEYQSQVVYETDWGVKEGGCLEIVYEQSAQKTFRNKGTHTIKWFSGIYSSYYDPQMCPLMPGNEEIPSVKYFLTVSTQSSSHKLKSPQPGLEKEEEMFLELGDGPYNSRVEMKFKVGDFVPAIPGLEIAVFTPAVKDGEYVSSFDAIGFNTTQEFIKKFGEGAITVYAFVDEKQEAKWGERPQ